MTNRDVLDSPIWAPIWHLMAEALFVRAGPPDEKRGWAEASLREKLDAQREAKTILRQKIKAEYGV